MFTFLDYIQQDRSWAILGRGGPSPTRTPPRLARNPDPMSAWVRAGVTNSSAAGSRRQLATCADPVCKAGGMAGRDPDKAVNHRSTPPSSHQTSRLRRREQKSYMGVKSHFKYWLYLIVSYFRTLATWDN